MIKVAITGNIASGKSVVQAVLEKKGYKVLDTDVVGHEVLKSNSEIITAFSKYDVFNADGSVSREKLGRLVFSDKNLKKKLEAISHPIIKNKIEKFFEENSSERVVFVAIPLLFEANMQSLFDKIVLVYANEEIRKQRLIERNNLSAEDAQKRISCQLPQEYKLKFADYILENNGSFENVKAQVERLCNLL